MTWEKSADATTSHGMHKKKKAKVEEHESIRVDSLKKKIGCSRKYAELNNYRTRGQKMPL